MPYYAQSWSHGRYIQIGDVPGWDDAMSDDDRWEFAKRLHNAGASSGVRKGLYDPQLDPKLAPSHYKLTKPKTKRPDVFRARSGVVLANDAVVSLVERFDPGRHQIIDTNVTNSRSEPLDGAPYRILHVLPVQEALVTDPEQVEKLSSTSDYYVLRGGRGVVTVREAALDPDIHLWKDPLIPSGWFLSDALFAALKERGLDFMAAKKARAA